MKKIDSSKSYKIEKYNNPHLSSKIDIPFLVNTIEMSSLEFVCVAGLSKFKNCTKMLFFRFLMPVTRNEIVPL